MTRKCQFWTLHGKDPNGNELVREAEKSSAKGNIFVVFFETKQKINFEDVEVLAESRKSKH